MPYESANLDLQIMSSNFKQMNFQKNGQITYKEIIRQWQNWHFAFSWYELFISHIMGKNNHDLIRSDKEPVKKK